MLNYFRFVEKSSVMGRKRTQLKLTETERATILHHLNTTQDPRMPPVVHSQPFKTGSSSSNTAVVRPMTRVTERVFCTVRCVRCGGVWGSRPQPWAQTTRVIH